MLVKQNPVQLNEYSPAGPHGLTARVPTGLR
jgi:hypothetical protein